MRSLVSIILVISAVFCSGCSTIGGHMFYPNLNPIYGGTREDCYEIVHKDYKDEPVMTHVVCAIDLPFSFVLDTIILPIDIYTWTDSLSSVDALKDWKSIGRYPFQVITSSSYSTNLPFSNTVANDVQHFIKEHNFKYGPGSPWFGVPDAIVFYEDGTGRHAVRMRIPLDMRGDTVVVYTLIYDRNDVRTEGA